MRTINTNPLRKNNGVSRGLSLLQASSWVMAITKIFFFNFIIIPSLKRNPQIIVSIIYTSLTILTLYLGYIVTMSDPTDKIVLEERRCLHRGEPFDIERYEYQCNFCNTCVSSDSKHCGVCNRCVHKFDHHCKWVNNCIGDGNYKQFIAMIVSLSFWCLAYLINGILFSVDFYTGKTGTIKHSKTPNHKDRDDWRGIIIIVTTAIVFFVFILDTQLIAFHIYLIKNNTRTYDYIMKQVEKEGKKKESKSKRKREKIIPIPTPSDNSNAKTPDQLKGNEDSRIVSPTRSSGLLEDHKMRNNRRTSDIEAFSNEQALQNQTSDEVELRRQLSAKSNTSGTLKATKSAGQRTPAENKPKEEYFELSSSLPPKLVSNKNMESLEDDSSGRVPFKEKKKKNPSFGLNAISDRIPERHFSESYDTQKRSVTVKDHYTNTQLNYKETENDDYQVHVKTDYDESNLYQRR